MKITKKIKENKPLINAQQILLFVFESRAIQLHICSVRIKHLQKNNLVKKLLYIQNEFKQLATGLLILLLCTISSFTNAQGWVEYYGDLTSDEGFSVTQTRDEGFIIASSFDGSSEIRLLKTDPNGKLLWEKTFGDLLTNEEVHQIIETQDGGFVTVGACNGCGVGGGKSIYVFKTTAKGDIVWTNSNIDNLNGDQVGYDVVESANGDIYIAGSSTGNTVNGEKDIYVVRLDSEGETTWANTFGSSTTQEEALALVETPDGNFALAGYTEVIADLEAPYIMRFNTQGDSLWSGAYPNAIVDSRATDIITSKNTAGVEADLVITGTVTEAAEVSYVFLMKLSALNQQEFFINHFSNNLAISASSVVQAADGSYVIAATTDISNAESSAIIIKKGLEGNSISDREIGRPGISGTITIASAEEIALTNDGGFIVVGSRTKLNFFDSDIQLIKLNGLCEYYTHYIQGNVFEDANLDCDLAGNEDGFKEWTVVAKGQGAEKTFYGSTDEFGNYSILVDTGSYILDVVTPNDYWLSCTENLTLNLFNTFDTTTVNFAVQEFDQCPSLQVDVATPYLEACTNAIYQVEFQNRGTISASGAYVEIELDAGLSYLNSDITPSAINGNSLTFDLGNIDIEEKGAFDIEVEVSCDAVFGEAHCVEAHIFPDSICGTNGAWNGSSVEVNVDCEGDNVKFTIENTGNAPTDPAEGLDYVIIEDNIMLFVNPDPIDLLVGGLISEELPKNGKTYRIIAEQASGHPGNSRPTVAIEGCTEDGSSNFSTGFFTQFPEDDKDVFVAKDCQENILIASQKPNFKRGYPKGYGDSLKVATTTDLSYNINFLNTGIDTAIRVVIRDTISDHLDPSTVQVGVSSHDFEYEVYDNGILKFTFENINLPPGGSIESRGFVKYKISQKPDNPIGTSIKNSAAAYFNFQRPTKTDTTCHHVGGLDWEDFVIVSTDEIFLPGVNKIEVYPNPFLNSAVIKIDSKESLKDVQFLLFDQNGKLVKRIAGNDQSFNIYREDLPAGLYVYRIESEGRPVSVGKVIVQ